MAVLRVFCANGSAYLLDWKMSEATEKNEKKSAGAKDFSLAGQIVAAVWVGGWNAFQFSKDILAARHIEVTDIIYSGIAIAACFSPVYVSILFDKIKAIRFGDK